MSARRRAASARPTLRDVAALAGVSIKTVSRVVNGEPGVVPSKVEAVRTAVAALDYRPNVSASSLRRSDGRTSAVAALLQDLANPFSAEVHRALEDAARARGVLVFAGSVDEDPDREQELVRAFVSRRADALLVAPASHDHAYLAPLVPQETPVVFVDRPPSGFEADAVLADNEPGATAATRHLLAHGHRRVAFLGDRRAISTARDRHAGHVRALAEAGVPLDERLARHDLVDADAAAAALLGLLDAAEPPTAVLAAQNNITVGAIRALHQRGLEHRVAVVGFDDFPMAELLRPGTTVLAQDPAEMGRRAADLLFARLGGDDSPTRTEVVPTRLLVRGSGEIPAPSR